ncbi:single-stranded-DNA-specific exonuclease RecJ [Conexibacter sp. SYSU D00693]|uniref:single-stranded-DNA-specific exonuclease RecJ n=1 Tax=Conexibacter sp. SYSU D00693 TaxID=2812560 RepID=UPI00196B0B7A|nr:single-stranded-DNA-specific exonuclease RecJ [Conexibacter sp. SYSU D00693]
MERRLHVEPVPGATVLALERELGVPHAVAQVLARRGFTDAAAARTWLAASERHEPSRFAGIEEAVALVLSHVRGGTRITVHGDYDVDGVCSTAILVRCLRGLGADVDWRLPSRTEDGYGLSARTVEELAARGTRLLVTADCAITAVDEVALAHRLGMDVVVTDHHAPRADGVLPSAPIVHPGVRGYPCPELCAGGVAHKLALALHAAAGAPDGYVPADDLDLVALATVADCVPLVGENRRLVREGLAALSRTTKPGLRALMRVARVDAARVDAGSIGFRLAPRINAAGRLSRADAALELVLTTDPARADAIADELDRANAERRHVETRILFEAEAQVAAQGEQPAYVLAHDEWHPGVIGIVASRIAERHHRPVVLVALDGEEGTGSGRSIPAFDLLGGLNASAGHLLRHGGHRAAAGCTVRRDQLGAFRAAFVAHAASVLSPEDLVPVQRVDAVVAGDELGLDLADALEQLAPFGMGNPSVRLLVPAARLVDPRTMGEGKHLRFTVESGGVRARAVAFGQSELPAHDGPLDAVFELERNEFNGAVEPRLVLRCACPPDCGEIVLVGEPAPRTAAWTAAVLEHGTPAGADEPLAAPTPAERLAAAPAPSLLAAGSPRLRRDRCGGGLAGTLGALVHTGESVLVVAADGPARARHLAGRAGGFAVCSWAELVADPSLAAAHVHVLALDPPPGPSALDLLAAGPHGGSLVLGWGVPETSFASAVLERDLDLRPLAAAVYRAVRAGGAAGLAASDVAALPARAVGRALRALAEVGVVAVDAAAGTGAVVPDAPKADLTAAPTAVAAARALEAGRAWLGEGAGRRVAAA